MNMYYLIENSIGHEKSSEENARSTFFESLRKQYGDSEIRPKSKRRRLFIEMLNAYDQTRKSNPFLLENTSLIYEANETFIDQDKMEEDGWPFNESDIKESISYRYGLASYVLRSLEIGDQSIKRFDQYFFSTNVVYGPKVEGVSYFDANRRSDAYTILLSEGVLKRKYKRVIEINNTEQIGLSDKECMELALSWLMGHEQAHIIHEVAGRHDFLDQMFLVQPEPNGCLPMDENLNFCQERHAEGIGVLCVAAEFDSIILRRKLGQAKDNSQMIDQSKKEALVKSIFNTREMERADLIRIAEKSLPLTVKLTNIVRSFCDHYESEMNPELKKWMKDFAIFFFNDFGRCLPLSEEQLAVWVKTLKN